MQTAKNQTLANLKSIIRNHSPFHSVQLTHFSQFPQGLPKGMITGLSSPLGGGATDFVVNLLKEYPNKRAAWIEPEQTVFPTALLQKGVGPHQVLFLQTEDQSLWACHECLRSQLFDFVILNDLDLAEKDLRRLQMNAEKTGTTVLLLSHEPLKKQTWAMSLQLEVQRSNKPQHIYQMLEAPEWQVHILKSRQFQVEETREAL